MKISFSQLSDFFIPAATTELDQGKKDKLVEIIADVNKPLEDIPIEEAVDFYKSVAAACEKMNTGKKMYLFKIWPPHDKA